MKNLAVIATIFIAQGAMLSGCVSGNLTRFKSTPAAATVSIPGYGECETPCTAALSSTVNVTIAKAGYKPKRLRVPAETGTVSVTLDLAAPTENVEAQTLPAL